MSDLEPHRPRPAVPAREPILLLPGAVTALCMLLIVVHLASTFGLDEEGQLQLSLWLGFLPYRLIDPLAVPGGMLPILWTLFTHALLHAGFEHLIFNTLWLAIFATPVARRYGTVPTLLVFFLSAAVGAIAFAATTLPDIAILIGASGGVAGLTGAATRFMFQPVIVERDPETGEPIVLGRRLASLRELLSSSRPRAFIIIWVGLNAAVPLLPLLMGAEFVQIAWQAHLGGFFTGLLLVPLFERGPGLRVED